VRRQRGGTLVHLKSRDLHELGELPVAASPEQEQAALDNGLRLLVKDIELRLLDNDGTASAILEAHRSLATDASLRQHLLGGILTGLSCAQAIVATGDHFCAQFRDSGNSYLQERVLDVRDVCFQLLQHIYGEARFRRRASCGKRPFALPTS
jgi:fructose-specific PTS system IIA-like component